MNQSRILRWNESVDRDPLPAAPFRTGPFHIDPTALSISDGVKTHRVERKVMEVMLCLVERAGETVTRETLFQEAWDGSFVSDSVLHRVISVLRGALNDDARNPRYIETVPRVGYRFLQDVEWDEPRAMPTSREQIRSARRWRLVALGALVTMILLAAVTLILVEAESPTGDLRLRPITTDPGFEFTPAVSTDGQWLAYAHFGGKDQAGLYVSGIDGSGSRRLMASADDRSYPKAPAWSPEGTRLAWITTSVIEPTTPDEDCRVLIQPLAAETPTHSFDCAAPGSLDWSPDGGRLLYTDLDREGRSRLREVEIETRESRWLTSPIPGHRDEVARYSPNGDRIAVVRSYVSVRSYLLLLGGSASQPWEYELPTGFVNGVDWWGQDELIVSVDSGYGVGQLWRLRLSDRALERIPETHGAHAPAVASGRILFMQDDYDAAIFGHGIRADADATEQRRVRASSTRIDVNPQLSPDGETIAFASDRSGTPQIWMSRANGSDQVVTDLDVYWLGPPRWSADGSKLLFEARRKEGFNVYVADLEAESTQNIEVPFDTFREPAWGPRGRLLISAPVDDRWELWMRDNGDSWSQFTKAGGFVSQLSKDGAWLYYTKFDEPGLWRMRSEGGREEQVLNWLDYDNRRDWALASDSIVSVRMVDGRRQLVRTKGIESDVITGFGEGLLLGVTASDSTVYYALMEFTGSDIQMLEAAAS